jgi:tetratricopeptide (TPR) repeat protein
VLRAACLALEILDAARTIAVDADADDPLEAPGVMLGMARGVAGCARDAEGTMLSYELVDDAAPLAHSLAASARAGEALVAGALYRIVRRAFVLREHTAKGGPTGVRAYALERARSRTERDRTSESQGWRLLGRETSLRELRNALVGATVTRQGRAALLTGELGIGKTTVLGAFASAIATTPGILGESLVIRVDGSVSAHGVRYGFLGQLVRHLLSLRHAARGATPPAAQLPDRPRVPPPLPRSRGSGEVAVPSESLPHLLDAVSERYGQGPAGRRTALHVLRVCLGMEFEEVGVEASTTRELGLVLRPMLGDAARERPVVLLFDALEQADAPSRAVVSELLRKPPPGLVLLVAALRDDDTLTRELAGMQTIALGALDADARRKLIATALGTDEPSDEIVREVSSVAGGNPLTILEVAEALVERAQSLRGGTNPGVDRERHGEAAALLRDDDVPLPPSLEEVLTARLEALAPEVRNLLRWCSLCEAELTVDLVDLLGGDEGPRVRARLVSDGILVFAGGVDARAVLTFAHPTLARVARASIEPTVVPAMHARIAELLERRKGLPGARAALVAALARHREAAGAERPAARSWLEAAALMVAGAAAPREAMHAFGRVLSLCRGAVDVEGYALRAAAREGREDLARAAGASRPRRTELLALRELAVEARDPRLVARALTRQARYKLETYAADADRDTVAAVRASRRAGESRTEAEARWVLAVYRGRRGMYREALAELDAALTALRARDADAAPPGGTREDGARAARALRVEVLLSKAALLRATGDTAACVAAAAEAHALAHAHGPRRLLAPTYEELGMACLTQGGYADALRFFRAAVALDREVGSRVRIVEGLVRGAQAWAALGLLDRALAWTQRARDLLTSLGHASVPATAVDVYATLAELLLERGDIDGAA